ncbi:hypothetical protein L226DRAFT_575053 [Lentinus tigrinus ALCF2SS1-7]|uniref:F-box domain-containing protein n=1 Tax=Lentinus tigrinus ALCF2SS1-6 TaxID=1328759 RepID=A0A5C2RVI0_9APHY|nr:hypothetical protein L227DRAFT_615532 [Lentinus tigrinus ALCF2SS1-6]RPD70151.1 hypothetical protein L226DRAFT_575053 [Lentinus tigrinus ALCF2SS1-7]
MAKKRAKRAPAPSTRVFLLAPAHHISPFAIVIPPEIIELIFEAYFAHLSPDELLHTLSCGDIVPSPTTVSHARARTLLGSVCMHWRRIVKRTADWWTHIEVSPQIQLSALTMALSHSRNRGLHLVFTFVTPGRAYSARRTAVPTFDFPQQSSRIQQAFDILASSAPRWASVTLFADHDELTEVFISALRITLVDPSMRLSIFNMPREYLYAGAPPSRRRSPRRIIPFPPEPLLTPSWPLTALSLRRCSISPHQMHTVISPSMLHLSLDELLTPINAAVLLEVLRLCPTLNTLRLSGSFLEHSPALGVELTGPPAPLHFLNQLTLGSMGIEDALLLCRILECPDLVSLRLDLPWTFIGHGAADFTAFIAHLACSDALLPISTLRQLTLRGLGIAILTSSSTAATMWCALPALVELHLNFPYLQIEYWSSLVAVVQDGHLPALAYLTVAGLSALDVQDFVLARQASSMPAVAITLVTHPRGPETQAPGKWLTWLRAHTIDFNVVVDPSRGSS